MKKKQTYKEKYETFKSFFDVEVILRNHMHNKIVISNKAYDIIFKLIKPEDFKEIFAELYDLREKKREDEFREKLRSSGTKAK